MHEKICPECGADWSDQQTCTDHFHEMLAWELQYQLYDVHHLLVLCFYLQHPSLYSPEALAGAKKMLVQFIDEGITPQSMRQQISQKVDSGTRDYKIKGTPDSQGVYEQPVTWTMVAGDVATAGIDQYYASVQMWAESVLKSLRESGNLTGV